MTLDLIVLIVLTAFVAGLLLGAVLVLWFWGRSMRHKRVPYRDVPPPRELGNWCGWDAAGADFARRVDLEQRAYWQGKPPADEGFS